MPQRIAILMFLISRIIYSLKEIHKSGGVPKYPTIGFKYGTYIRCMRLPTVLWWFVLERDSPSFFFIFVLCAFSEEKYNFCRFYFCFIPAVSYKYEKRELNGGKSWACHRKVGSRGDLRSGS